MAYDTPVRLDGLLAKIESSYGVDPTPTAAADGVRVARRLWPSLRYAPRWPNRRTNVANNLIWPAKPAIPRGRIVELDIWWEMRGAGSDAVVEADPLIRACGWAQVDGASVFTYTLAATAHESCTIWAYAGGLVWKISGCRGSIVWPFTPGEPGVIRFLMQGRLSAEPATASVPAISSYDTTEPIAGVNTQFSVGGVWTPAFLPGGEFNQGCTPEWTEDANGTDGLGEFDWAAAEPFLQLTARKVALATYDPWADEKARTARALSATWGSVQFNRMTLSLPETYVQTPTPADSEGWANVALRYDVAGTSAAPVISST